MKKSQFYTTLASYYDFLCGDRKQDVKNLETLIKKHQKSKGKNLLDVACGTGLEDFYLKKHFNVTGLDLNTGVLEIAKKRNPEVPYRKGDMQHFNLKQKFDIITCFDAMIYLQTPQALEKTLGNFYRHLKKGGLLIF